MFQNLYQRFRSLKTSRPCVARIWNLSRPESAVEGERYLCRRVIFIYLVLFICILDFLIYLTILCDPFIPSLEVTQPLQTSLSHPKKGTAWITWYIVIHSSIIDLLNYLIIILHGEIFTRCINTYIWYISSFVHNSTVHRKRIGVPTWSEIDQNGFESCPSKDV